MFNNTICDIRQNDICDVQQYDIQKYVMSNTKFSDAIFSNTMFRNAIPRVRMATCFHDSEQVLDDYGGRTVILSSKRLTSQFTSPGAVDLLALY
jgi:hypothetical protein